VNPDKDGTHCTEEHDHEKLALLAFILHTNRDKGASDVIAHNVARRIHAGLFRCQQSTVEHDLYYWRRPGDVAGRAKMRGSKTNYP
jgi:hypothetical protein